LNKGLPDGSCVLLVGPPRAGKTIFCESLAANFLQGKMGCLYVAVDRAPADVREDFERLGTDSRKMESEKKLAFVDAYSWLTGESEEMFHIENLANLTEIIIMIERAYTYLNQRLFLILDSVSPLPIHNPEADVIKFLQLLTARLRNWRGTGIYTMQAGVHSENFLNSLTFLVDGVFEMKIKEEEGAIKRFFRIGNLRFAAPRMTWMPYVIEGDKGFRLQEMEASY
jgi:KaiC/GvpD/RAD55 family RecA-like ATPase